MKYPVLIFLWIIWCAIHSGMTTLRFNQYLKRALPSYYRFYRLFFNLVAFSTLIPLIVYSRKVNGPLLFRFEGFPALIQYLFLILALLLFIAGALKYDMLEFFGIRQIKSGKSHATLSRSGDIDKSGILNFTRHPWYLATIIFVWVADGEIYLSAFIVKVLLTIYVLIGTVLEEGKLVVELGGSYREYKASVSRLIPVKWVCAKLSGAKKTRWDDR